MKEGDFGKALTEMKDLEELLRALSGKKRDGKLSEEELAKLQKLSQELERLSKDSKLLSKLSSKLGAASASLSAGDLSDARKSLEGLEGELESLDRLAEEMKFLEDAMDLAQLSLDDLANLHKCPNCGKISLEPGGT